MTQKISDPSDPLLAPYRDVADPAALERKGLFVAEGRLVVERLLEDARFDVHSVAATHEAVSALTAVLGRRPGTDVYECDAAALRQVTGFAFHRGCLALAYRPRQALNLADVLSATRMLALEGVTDPDNVGGLFRAALAFGVDAVILDGSTADPFYRKAIRTSMAATLRVPFVRVTAWLEGLDALRAAGLRIVALTPHPDAVPLGEYAARRRDRQVIVAGSEGFGMSEVSLARADVRVRIPVEPRADSLNVVTAAAIALYTLT